jgi:hypothetical protein
MDARIIAVIVLAVFLVLTVSAYYDELTGMITGEGSWPMKIEGPAAAGQFYPREKWELEGFMDGLFGEQESRPVQNLKAMITPHAEYAKAADVYKAAYQAIPKGVFTRFIIIGPSHYKDFYGFSVPDATHWRTPLGMVKVSMTGLKLESLHVNDASIYESEHSFETQIPFIQSTLGGDAEVILIVAGNINPAVLGDVISPYLDGKTMLIVTSDFGGYMPYDRAVDADRTCIDAVNTLNFTGAYRCQMDGKAPVMALMYIAQKNGWAGSLLKYDAAGGKNGAMGFAAVAFSPARLSDGGKQRLITLVRETAASAKAPATDAASLEPELLRVSGCMVALRRNGVPAGSYGSVFPKAPLYKCVTDNALALLSEPKYAWVRDTSGNDTVEISVLTAPQFVEHISPDDVIKAVVPGEDGVMISHAGRSMVFFPQAWEDLPDAQQFLTKMCTDMGASADCWTKKEATIETFRAETFTG